MAANLGRAFIRVTAVTDGFQKSLNKLGDGGSDPGARFGRNFASGFSKGFGDNKQIFGPKFFKEADQAGDRLRSLIRLGYVLGPTFAAIGGIIGSLGSALFTLGAAAVVASQSLVVLPASLAALAQAAVVARVAMIGVGKAIQAGLKQAGGGGAAQAEALQNALERLEDARIRLARAEEDRAERIAEANKKVVNAEEDYIDAQYESEKAARALARAREEAAEDLQQLRFETEDAAISEAKARLEFERSRESLQRVQDLPPNSRARREAELAFAEADLNLRRSIDRNADLKKAEREATAAGIDGSDKVLSASEALAKAKEREADAYEAVQEAIVDAARAQRDANRQVADAQKAVARALQDVENATKGATGGVNQFAEAMKDLSPEAQAFVRYIVSIKDEFKALRAAAGEQLFPKLTEAIDNLVKNLLPRLVPLFRDTGSVLGDIAKDLSSTVTSVDNLGRLERVWKTNDELLKNFGGAASNLYEVFLIILDAADTLILRFGDWTEQLTDSWKQTLNAEGATEKLRAKFERAGDVAAQIGTIFGNTFGGLLGLIDAINKPGGAIDVLLGKLEAVTAKFESFAINPENADKINTFFTNSVVNAGKLGTILGNVLEGFGKIGASEEFGAFLDKIVIASERVGAGFEKIASGKALESFGNLILELSRTFEIFTDNESITIFFDTLATVLGKVNDFFESDLGKKILDTVGPLLAFLSAVSLVGEVGKFFGLGIIGNIGKMVITFRLLQKLGLVGSLGGIATAILGVVGAIAIFAGAFYLLWQNSETFRTAIQELWTFLKESFLGAIEDISNAFKDAFGNVGTLKDTLQTVGDFIGTFIVPILSGIFARALERVVGIIQGVIYFIGALKDVFIVVVNIIAGLILTLVGKGEQGSEKFKQAWSGLKSFFSNLFKGIYSIFAGFINGAIGLVNELIKGFNKLPGPDLPLIPKLPEASSFAQGGTIFPQPGGALIRVAEAGRPERVEPLDSNGLSNRDKALISFMSGGAGSGPTINVYPSPGMDERQIAEMVSRKLAFQMRKGGI